MSFMLGGGIMTPHNEKFWESGWTVSLWNRRESGNLQRLIQPPDWQHCVCKEFRGEFDEKGIWLIEKKFRMICRILSSAGPPAWYLLNLTIYQWKVWNHFRGVSNKFSLCRPDIYHFLMGKLRKSFMNKTYDTSVLDKESLDLKVLAS